MAALPPLLASFLRLPPLPAVGGLDRRIGRAALEIAKEKSSFMNPPLARLLGHRPYRLIVLSLMLMVATATAVDGVGLPSWGSLGETRVMDVTRPSGALAPESDRGGAGVDAAASRTCSKIKNKKRRRQCRRQNAAPLPTPTPIPSAPETDAVLLAAGDIARCDRPGDEATAALLESRAGTVAALGDIAYESGTPQEFSE